MPIFPVLEGSAIFSSRIDLDFIYPIVLVLFVERLFFPHCFIFFFSRLFWLFCAVLIFTLILEWTCQCLQKYLLGILLCWIYKSIWVDWHLTNMESSNLQTLYILLFIYVVKTYAVIMLCCSIYRAQKNRFSIILKVSKIFRMVKWMAST